MKTALILFNLGGPDGPEAVKPFLFNLFNDRAIISLPQPVRWLLAKLIAARRAPVARAIYDRMGGRSPILPNTERQAEALQALLGPDFKCFIAMRYWRPRAREQVAMVKAWGPDRVVMLPLYPQFSTTTTGSSLNEWRRQAIRSGLQAQSVGLCCYPINDGFVTAVAERVREGLRQLKGSRPARVLFTAHGLPKKIVDAGDPYQLQVERSVSAVVDRLALPDLDWLICYQSRVGPLEWIGPSTEAEVSRAGAQGVALVVVPIAFVSEHSETLVELDIEYRELAHEKGVPEYIRVGTVDADPHFIAGLAEDVRRALSAPQSLCSGSGERFCPADRVGCPCL